MKEIWKDIPGYIGRYQISNIGRVKSLSYKRSNGFGIYATKEKILKPFIESGGYLKINLYNNRQCKKYKIHRLVAMAFIPNPENKPEIDHINTCINDNRVENLRWVTSSENHLNPITRVRITESKRGNHYRKKSIK